MRNRTKQYEIYMQSAEWRKLRNEKLHLDPVCELCGIDTPLHVHHVKYKQLYNAEVKHLMTLCEYHHRWVHEVLRHKLIKRHHKGSTIKRLIWRYYNQSTPESP